MDRLVCIDDFESQALEILSRNAGDYYKSGSDDQVTLEQNRSSFSKILIRPRMLRDVSVRKLEINVLGKKVSFPVGVSPTAFQSLAHPTGEIENARAAAAAGSIFVLSTFSNWSIEDVAIRAPGGRKWFQLFPNVDDKVTLDLMERAEKWGYEALVVTLDAQLFGNKRCTKREAFKLPAHLKGAANMEKFVSLQKNAQNISNWVHETLKQDMTWKTIAWIRRKSGLPLVLKGILTPEDAKLAVIAGMDGIWVSNHGGRQIDTVIPSIEALKGIVEVVDNRCEVYIDSGIRQGSDVFKALALGATMAFVGRPMIWGLAVAGEAGSAKVLQILIEELDLTMALSGVADVKDINDDYISDKQTLISHL